MSDLRKKPEAYWKEKLTPEQYRVVRQKGTERAFTGALYNNHEKGVYECVACGHPLFSSDAKFESGTGWPSFDSRVNLENVELACRCLFNQKIRRTIELRISFTRKGTARFSLPYKSSNVVWAQDVK